MLGFIYTFWVFFPFVYQFYTRMTSTLVESKCWNPAELYIFIAFHNNFKIFLYGAEEASFAPIFFKKLSSAFLRRPQKFAQSSSWFGRLLKDWFCILFFHPRTRPKTSLQCFALDSPCSKVKLCRNVLGRVLGRKYYIQNPSLSL